MAMQASRPAQWNPNGVDVPLAVPEYVKTSPDYLDGSLIGDAGFDPLCMAAYSWPALMEKGMGLFGENTPGLILNLPDLSSEQRKKAFDSLSAEEQKQSVLWMREAELKHGRLAMLAVLGWPLGEIVNSGFLHSYADLNGRTPSLLNGGLLEVYGPMWFIFLGAASYVELTSIEAGIGANGDYKFDPLNLNSAYDKDVQLKELKNGRLAMMAITGFAFQEAVWGTPVVDQTPIFFTFFGDVLAPGALKSLGLF